MSTKVLVIGLDGANFQVMHPLIQTGHLDNIARLMREGTSGELRTTMPPVSGPAWHAFKTGKNPGTTGVYDFLRYDPQRYQSILLQLGQLPDPTLWDIAAHYSDYRFGIYNLPTTYPPAKVKGFMVAGFPLPDDAPDYVYPLELKATLDSLTGDHKTDIRYRDYERHKDFLMDVNSLIDQRVKVYHYLKNEYDPDVFIFIFTCPDRVQHRMWKYMDPQVNQTPPRVNPYRELVEDFWQHLDDAVGELLKSVDENTTVIVISDHGFGPQCETFYINQWLCQRGYLTLKAGKDQRRLVSNFLLGQALKTARNVLKHFTVPAVARRFAPKVLKRTLQPEIPFESMLELIDWSRTQAYSPIHTSVFGTIYVNLHGREGQGSVDRYEYEKLRDRLIGDFHSLNKEIPNFQVKVFKREDVYQGSYLDHAPDMVYVINDFRCVSRSSLGKGPVFETRSLGDNYSGTHRLEGIFVAKGPQIKRGHWLGQAEIVDIVPTVLHILNTPIPDDIDGKVLKDIFQPNSELARRDIDLVNASSMQVTRKPKEFLDKSVWKRLEGLGYL
ncbi:MAG: alkaline phosphatase family protein [Candidatus Hodarchaeota archaeon]